MWSWSGASWGFSRRALDSLPQSNLILSQQLRPVGVIFGKVPLEKTVALAQVLFVRGGVRRIIWCRCRFRRWSRCWCRLLGLSKDRLTAIDQHQREQQCRSRKQDGGRRGMVSELAPFLRQYSYGVTAMARKADSCDLVGHHRATSP